MLLDRVPFNCFANIPSLPLLVAIEFYDLDSGDNKFFKGNRLQFDDKVINLIISEDNAVIFLNRFIYKRFFFSLTMFFYHKVIEREDTLNKPLFLNNFLMLLN